MAAVDYLVTGAHGFLGRYVIRQLVETNAAAKVLGLGRSPDSAEFFTHAVTCGTTRFAAPVPQSLRCNPSRTRYVSLDLANRGELARLLEEFQPGTVLHLAGALRDEPLERLLRSNVIATANLVEAVAASGVPIEKLVVCSSGGVYGRPFRVPIHEEDTCRPLDLYSVSKLAAEHAAAALAEPKRLPVVFARVFNLVGPGQHDRHACAAFTSQAAAIKARLSPPTMRVGALGDYPRLPRCPRRSCGSRPTLYPRFARRSLQHRIRSRNLDTAAPGYDTGVHRRSGCG